jgi:hypothetical protein
VFESGRQVASQYQIKWEQVVEHSSHSTITKMLVINSLFQRASMLANWATIREKNWNNMLETPFTRQFLIDTERSQLQSSLVHFSTRTSLISLNSCPTKSTSTLELMRHTTSLHRLRTEDSLPASRPNNEKTISSLQVSLLETFWCGDKSRSLSARDPGDLFVLNS